MENYEQLVIEIEQRPKMSPNEYWKLIVDNSSLIFWACQEHSKASVASDLGLKPQDFSLVYKIVYALVSK